MAGHEKVDERVRRQAREELARLGRELREARLAHDLSQASAARAIGISASSWGRTERGEAGRVPYVTLVRAFAVVGLELRGGAFPGGEPFRDDAHLRLLERLRVRLGPGVRWMTEVPLPIPGDRRAWDAMILVAGVRIGVEAETRVRDAQALQRRLELKRRDGEVDHVILLLSNTRHNRWVVRSVGAGLMASFPVDGHEALGRLASATDPGGSSIILL